MKTSKGHKGYAEYTLHQFNGAYVLIKELNFLNVFIGGGGPFKLFIA